MNLQEYFDEFLNKVYANNHLQFEIIKSVLRKNEYKLKIQYLSNRFDEGAVFDFKIEDDKFVLINFTQSRLFRQNKIYHYDKSAKDYNYILNDLTEKYFLNKKLNEKLIQKKSKEKINKI